MVGCSGHWRPGDCSDACAVLAAAPAALRLAVGLLQRFACEASGPAAWLVVRPVALLPTNLSVIPNLGCGSASGVGGLRLVWQWRCPHVFDTCSRLLAACLCAPGACKCIWCAAATEVPWPFRLAYGRLTLTVNLAQMTKSSSLHRARPCVTADKQPER
jgi:hypothetical protein